MNKKNPCLRIQQYIMLHPGKDLPKWMKIHISQCNDCQFSLDLEQQLIRYRDADLASLSLDSERDYEVRSAIIQASQRIEKQQQKGVFWKVLWQKPAWITLSCILLLGLWTARPLIQDMSVWYQSADRKIAQLLSDETTMMNTSDMAAMTLESARSDASSIASLRFAGSMFASSESQKLFWTQDQLSLNRAYWLWIKFLSDSSLQNLDQVKKLLEEYEPSQVMRKLGLPVNKTVKDFEKYLNRYRIEAHDEILILDGLVTAVYWREAMFRIDVLEEFIHIDPVLLHHIHPEKMLRFSLKEQDSSYYVVALEEPLLKSILFEGTILESRSDELLFSAYPDPLRITSHSFFSNCSRDDLPYYSEDRFQIRLIHHEDQHHLFSLIRKGIPMQQTLSGVIDLFLKHGFTLQDYRVNCIIDSSIQIFPDHYTLEQIVASNRWITVEGIQYDDQFYVSSIHVLENPLEPPSQETYLLASAPMPSSSRVRQSLSPQPSAASTASESSSTVEEFHTDIVVGCSDSLLHLASGKSIDYHASMVVPGSKVEWHGNPTKPELFTSIQLGRPGKISTAYRILNRLDNHVYILGLKDASRPLYLYSTSDLPREGIIQAQVIAHDHLSVAIESRYFTLNEVLTLRGTVVKAMNRENMYLLDNDTMFILDELSQLIHGPIWPGSTVTVKGVRSDQSFKAYIVEVEREGLVFTGIIVSIDRSTNSFRLDSGTELIIADPQWWKKAEEVLAIGSAVIIRAYREGSRLIVTDILDAKDYVSDKGVTT